jgi:UDP-N-acetylglucosamine 1-carboxyvinyltransferase
MSKIIINGGHSLSGSIAVHGAKNAVLPILAATVLCSGVSVIKGCPHLSDVDYSIKILRFLGCRVKREGSTVTVDSSGMKCTEIPEELMLKMRSSITFLGPITAKHGNACMCAPGGCELGPRPIDLHIKAFKRIGIKVVEQGGFIKTTAKHIKGADIHLDFPSVGATENVMMAAVLAEGKTTITNAAKEPEIIDLEAFLNKMGAKVSGAGSDVIVIEGVKTLKGTEHTVIPDRIVAATYLCAAAMTGGNVELTNVDPLHLKAVISVLKDSGSIIYMKRRSILLEAPKRIMPIDMLRTMPHPGFPTDAQAVITAMLTVSSGTSIIVENIFENRFKHCDELNKMGANIKSHGRVAIIQGVPELCASQVTAMDLRGGAALVIAGLAASGQSVVSGCKHIDRGYESIVRDMQALGADICRK